MLLQDAFSVDINGVQSKSNGQAVQTVTETVTPESSPSPSEKYPYLTAVKDMFWNTFENINKASENGKLDTRAARNMMRNVLSDDQFWSSLTRLTRKRLHVAYDKKRADRKIQKCNMLTSAITSPIATQGFENIANELCATVSSIRPDIGCTNSIQLVADLVNGGSVARGLDAISDVVSNVDLCPRRLIKGFDHIHNMLKIGGIMKMNGGIAKGLMSMTSNFK